MRKLLQMVYDRGYCTLLDIRIMGEDDIDVIKLLTKENPELSAGEVEGKHSDVYFDFLEIDIEEQDITEEQCKTLIELNMHNIGDIDFIQLGLDEILIRINQDMQSYEEETGIYIWQDNTDEEYQEFIYSSNLSINVEELKYVVRYGNL